MKQFTSKLIEKLQLIYRTYRQIIQIRWVRLSLQTILILASLIFLASNFSQYSNSLKDIHINYLNILVSFGIVTLNLFIGALIWWLLLRSLDQKVDLLGSARAQILSNIAKYLPGYGWQLVGKSYLTNQMGVSSKAIIQGLTFELGLLVVIGIAFALMIVPMDILTQWPITRQAPELTKVIFLILSLLIMLVMIALPWLLIRIKVPVSKIELKPYWISIATISASWWLLSFAFWVLGAAFTTISLSEYPTYAFALTMSILIGLAILILPSGIGIRESLMVILLQPVLAAPMAVLIAATFRLITIFCDFISALAISLLYRRFKNLSVIPQQNNHP